MRDFFKNKLYTESLIIEEEVTDWYDMSPAERFMESQKLWEVFILLA